MPGTNQSSGDTKNLKNIFKPTLKKFGILMMVVGVVVILSVPATWLWGYVERWGLRDGKWKLQLPHDARTYEGFKPGRDGIPGDTGTKHVQLALYDLDADVARSESPYRGRELPTAAAEMAAVTAAPATPSAVAAGMIPRTRNREAASAAKNILVERTNALKQ